MTEKQKGKRSNYLSDVIAFRYVYGEEGINRQAVILVPKDDLFDELSLTLNAFYSICVTSVINYLYDLVVVSRRRVK